MRQLCLWLPAYNLICIVRYRAMILSVERSGNRTEYHYSIKTRFTKRERLLPERDPRLRCCSISQKETIGSALSLSLSPSLSPSLSFVFSLPGKLENFHREESLQD